MSINLSEFENGSQTSFEGIEVAGAQKQGLENSTMAALRANERRFRETLDNVREAANEDGVITEEEAKEIQLWENGLENARADNRRRDENVTEVYSQSNYDAALDDLEDQYPNVPRHVIEIVALERATEKYRSDLGGHLTPKQAVSDPDLMEDEQLNSTLTDLNKIHSPQNISGDSETDSSQNDNLNDETENDGTRDPFPDGTYAPPTSPFPQPRPDDLNTGWWPIIVDLDQDGIEIEHASHTFFDVDGDGFAEQTSWAAADDGFLVIDLNEDGTRGTGDGKIDQSREMAFSLWGSEGDTDLQGLARAFNDDDTGTSQNVLDANDSVWNELYIWQDVDQDGEVDQGELKTLSDLGISQIGLGYDDGSAFSDTTNDINVFGNVLHGLASYTRNGQSIIGGIGDISLAYNTLGWREVETGLGYSIEFESGERYDYAVIGSDDNPHVNLNSLQLDGATGDERVNILNATNATVTVAISGGGGNDRVYGGVNDDMLAGDEGADTIIGGAGDDQIFFDADDVQVFGGYGYDFAIVATEEAVDFNLGTNHFEAAYGNDGDDTFFGGTVYESVAIYGGDGADTLTGGAADDDLSGDDGNDSIVAGSGDDFITGGAGKDSIEGGTGDDFILGGEGNDRIEGESGDDQVIGGSGNDWIAGFHGDDRLIGSEGSDKLYGASGDDELFGGDDNDILVLGTGDDEAFGGDGDDIFHVTGSLAVYDAVFGGTGNDTLMLQGNSDDWTIVDASKQEAVYHSVDRSDEGQNFEFSHYEQYGVNQFFIHKGDTFIDVQDIERINFAGSNDTISLTGVDVEDENSDTYYRFSSTSNVNANYLWMSGAWTSSSANNEMKSSWEDHDGHTTYGGVGGDNLFFGAAGDDAIDAGGGSDELIGGFGSDSLNGGGHNDTITGNTGDDFLIGGQGDDSLFGGDGADYIYGGSRNDSIEGGSGSDWISGGDGHDKIKGEDGADFVDAGAGNDTVYGGNSSDQIFGQAGQDSLYGGLSSDVLNGGDGSDLLDGGYGDDTLVGGAGQDTLRGAFGSDLIYGDNGDDQIFASYGDDLVFGGDGIDSILGGEGADLLEGGAGADIIDGGFGIRDVVSYSSSDARVIVNLLTNDISSGHAEGDVLTGIEGIIGSDHYDFLVGNNSNNVIFGGKGNDLISGASGHDTLYGGEGDDRLLAGAGTDDLFGGAGNDSFHSGSGISGQGRQYFEGGTGEDLYEIGKWGGDQQIVELSDTATLGSNEEGEGSDTVRFYNLNAADIVFSTDNEDLLATWAQGSLRINDGGANIERFEFADGSTISTVTADFLSVIGESTEGDTRDRLIGTSDDDLIYGTSETNYIYGGHGNDVIAAGGYSVGKQYLSGNSGDDTYLYSKENKSVWITNFGEGQDSGSDTFEFTDLNIDELSFSSYSHHNQGDVLLIHWDDEVTNGQIELANKGSHIETYRFENRTELQWFDLWEMV